MGFTPTWATTALTTLAAVFGGMNPEAGSTAGAGAKQGLRQRTLTVPLTTSAFNNVAETAVFQPPVAATITGVTYTTGTTWTGTPPTAILRVHDGVGGSTAQTVASTSLSGAAAWVPTAGTVTPALSGVVWNNQMSTPNVLTLELSGGASGAVTGVVAVVTYVED